jgi:WD40 repeat protein
VRGLTDSAFSPDGRRFAAVCCVPGHDGAFPPVHVRVWDLEGGREACAPLAGDALADGAFSPDGARLVVSRRDRSGPRVSVWDVDGGRELAGWSVPGGAPSALVVSPDGTRVAVVTSERPPGEQGEDPPAEPRAVRIWEAATGKELPPLPLGRLSGGGPWGVRVVFGPDGSRLAVERWTASVPADVGADVTVWDVPAGKPLPPPAGLEVRRTAVRVGGVTFSPDGKQLVSAEGNVLRTWDTDTGRPLLTLRGHVTPIAAWAVAPDGRRLWSLEAGGLLKEWDARPPAPVAVRFAAARTTPLSSVTALGQGGARSAALIDLGQGERPSPAVRVWDAAGRAVRDLVPSARDPDSRPGPLPAHGAVALDRDGRRAVLGRDGVPLGIGRTGAANTPPDLTVWDVDSGAVLLHQRLDGRGLALAAVSPDGRVVAAAVLAERGPSAVRIFDVDGRRERPPLTVPGGRTVMGASLSPDGRRLLGQCVTLDRAAREAAEALVLWDVDGGAARTVLETPHVSPSLLGGFAARVAWSPDGSRFALTRGPANGAPITVHDAATGRAVLTLDQPLTGVVDSPAPPCLAYSPDGTRIAGVLPGGAASGPPVLKVWDAACGKELLELRLTAHGSAAGARHLAFSGDGSRLALAESETEPIRSPDFGAAQPVTRSLLLTTWDATPVARRQPSPQ